MSLTATELLRHALATIAYRATKVLRDAPEGFGEFEAGAGVRAPSVILAHMGDLMDWAVTMVRGEVAWIESPERDWQRLVDRFHLSLATLDGLLTAHELDARHAQQLLRGPLADALTHVGQLALLRRLSGGPVRGENYARAEITTGRVGRDQPPPVREF
jgi:hypothetical protein